MWQSEKQAGSYRQARTLAVRRVSVLDGCSARYGAIAFLLLAVASTGCGRAPFAPARADGGRFDARGLADAVADVAADTAADIARDIPAAGAADGAANIARDVPAAGAADGAANIARDAPAAGGAEAGADGEPVIPAKLLGEPCESAGECSSGFCADGVCCSSACTETCKTCAAPSSLGACAYVASGVAPPKTNDCVASAPSTCGLDGTCDGAGACRSYRAGTECGGRACQGSVVTSVSTCDGAGACQPGMLVDCAPYSCDPASGTCLKSCSSDAQCEGGFPCVNGSCFVRSPVMPCSVNADCASGFCVDGACCTSACEGPCVSCNLVHSVGTCTPVAAGAPDPHAICRSEPASTCGQTGACDGMGGCALSPQGLTCSAASCSDGLMTQVSVCDGKGTCTPGPKLSCEPFGCSPNGVTCSRGCRSDSICMGGAYCWGDEQCAPKKKNGEPCASNHECLSGGCENGACCDSACDGPCVRCNQNGPDGGYTPLPSDDGGLVRDTSADATED